MNTNQPEKYLFNNFLKVGIGRYRLWCDWISWYRLTRAANVSFILIQLRDEALPDLHV